MEPATLAKALRALRAGDPRLVPLIEGHGPPTFRRTRNALESLSRAIVYQQLSPLAAGTIYRRFLQLYPGARFPRAPVIASTPIARLRSVGLSASKASYLVDLAEHFADGRIQPRLFSRMADTELASTLMAVRGIGPWSVDMFLMFGLNRPDVLPVGDLGVRKGMQLHFGLRSLPKQERMVSLARCWQPYRSVASWYMWRVVEAAPRGSRRAQ